MGAGNGYRRMVLAVGTVAQAATATYFPARVGALIGAISAGLVVTLIT